MTIGAVVVVAVAIGLFLVAPRIAGSPCSVELRGSDVIVRLRGVFRILGLKQQFRFPLSSVKSVRIVHGRKQLPSRAWLRGTRIGTYVPGATIVGTFRSRGEKSFWAIQRGNETLVIELAGEALSRVVVEVDDARAATANLTRATEQR